MWAVSLGGDEGSQMLARAGLLDQVRLQGPVQLLCNTGSTVRCSMAEGAAQALSERLMACRTQQQQLQPADIQQLGLHAMKSTCTTPAGLSHPQWTCLLAASTVQELAVLLKMLQPTSTALLSTIRYWAGLPVP